MADASCTVILLTMPLLDNPLDAIDQVPAWAIALFVLGVAASWLPPIRNAPGAVSEVVVTATFLAVAISLSTGHPMIATWAILVFALVILTLVLLSLGSARKRPDSWSGGHSTKDT